MATGSATSTITSDPSHYLSSSISSLSSQRAQSSWIAKTYRHSAQLYLTRRLSEALTAIEPVITPEQDASNGISGGQELDGHDSGDVQPAPVAAASRGTRVKIWSFYLTLLNAVIELGPEEGKLVFGSTKWRTLAAKARDGTVWDEVVRLGYGGAEGEVDGEVVANLATLLLTHMPSQKLNQQKLETYLSASSLPVYDITAHMEASQDGQRRPNGNGTSTPRDLNTRLKLLELYTLHVLPQNGEWDYARDFINMSEVLDEERREAFQHALQSLREEKSHDAIREAELKKRQEEELEARRQEEVRKRQEEAQAEQQRKKREAEQKQKAAPSPTNGSHKGTAPRAAPANGQGARKPPVPGSAKNVKAQKSSGTTPPPNLYKRATWLVASLQSSILNARQSVMRNPMVVMRFLLFLFAFVIAFARRDVRERIRRTVGSAYDRVKRTVGMGVKVSYI